MNLINHLSHQKNLRLFKVVSVINLVGLFVFFFLLWDVEIATFTSETLKGLVKLQLCVARAV